MFPIGPTPSKAGFDANVTKKFLFLPTYRCVGLHVIMC